MSRTTIFRSMWVRYSLGLAAVAALLVGVLVLRTSGVAVVAQEPEPVPTVSPADFNNPKPAFSLDTPLVVEVEMVVEGSVAGASDSGCSSATRAVNRNAVFIYTTINSATTTRPTGVSQTLTSTAGYSVPSSGAEYLRFRDGRVLFLPPGVKLHGVARIYSCYENCGSPPLYELRKTNGQKVVVDSNGRVIDRGPNFSIVGFEFLNHIYPQDTDAPGALNFD